MRMQQDFKILQKTYDMILYGNTCLKQFPKSERYALAADIKNSKYIWPWNRYIYKSRRTTSTTWTKSTWTTHCWPWNSNSCHSWRWCI